EGIRSWDADQSSDSEHVLLNVIDAAVPSSLPEEIMVVLATERVPCWNCTDTIIRFLHRHPVACVSVAYTFDSRPTKEESVGRTSEEFVEHVRQYGIADRVE